MGNLGALFSLAYDRGGKVIEMIRNRLGEDRFFEFWRVVYRKYAWKTFRYDDFKRELAAFDPAGDWPAFLNSWLIDHAETDWVVERVSYSTAEAESTERWVEIGLHKTARWSSRPSFFADAEPMSCACRFGPIARPTTSPAQAWCAAVGTGRFACSPPANPSR